MALFDLVVFLIVAAVFVGIIIGIKKISKQINNSIASTKDSLRQRGYTISDKGLSVKSNGRYSREDYVDATQRGFIKAMGASSFSTAQCDPSSSSAQNGLTPDGPAADRMTKPVMLRSTSTTSANSQNSNEGDKKRRFGLRKREKDA